MPKPSLKSFPKGLTFLWSKKYGVIKDSGVDGNIITGKGVGWMNYCVYPRVLSIKEIKSVTKLLREMD